MKIRRGIGCAIAAAVTGIGAWSGCANDATEIKLSTPADLRPDVTEATAARGPIRLPSPTAFNLTPFTSNESGTCTAKAKSTPDGSALANVEAKDGGSGWAEFQLGYTFDNTGSGPLHGLVELSADFSQRAESSSDDPMNAGTVTVRFLIKDSNGTTLHNEALVESGTDAGPRKLSAQQTTMVDAEFQAELGYYVLLSARSAATSTKGNTATAGVEIKNCKMSISWLPVESRKATTQAAAATR